MTEATHFEPGGRQTKYFGGIPGSCKIEKKIKKYQYAEYSTKLSCFKNVKTQTKIELRKKTRMCPESRVLKWH